MGGAAAISDEFGKRHPLLQELVVADAPDSLWEALPRFLGFLLSAAESRSPQICCVLLPEMESVGYLTSTLLALSKLRAEFPDLLRGYATRDLEYGQKVRVLPHGYVYKYGGLWPSSTDFFELRVLNASDKARRTFPVDEILRLEPTERVLPKGKGATDLGQFRLSPLDRLIGIQTGGNTSLFRNHVFYLSARVEFEDLASTIRLARRVNAGAGAGNVSADIIPWGLISSDGRIEREDRYQRKDEPLIAVTHSVDYLADACEAAPRFSKFVIVNEAEKLSRNLQAYDRIAASQRVLIIASHRSVEAVDPLAERGATVWRLSAAELLLDESAGDRCRSNGLVGRLFRAVRNWQQLDLIPVGCSDDRLERVAAHLQTASNGISPEQADEQSGRLLGRLFSVLCHASDACDAPSGEEIEDAKGRLELCLKLIEEQAVWLSSEVASNLRAACQGLASVYEGKAGELGRSKGAALLQLVRELIGRNGQRVAVVTRTSARAQATEAWLERQGMSLRVMSVGETGSDEEFGALVLTAWPNSRQLGDLIGRYVSPRIYLVGYEFERAWFRVFKRHQARRMAEGSLSAAEKSAMTGLPEGLLELLGEPAPAREAGDSEGVGGRLSVSRIEDILHHRRKGVSAAVMSREEMREAKYVGFVGATYAHLTEWQHVPVVTALVRATASSRQAIAMRTVEELNAGDYIVFREGGESNIIRSIAEEIVGRERYAELREVAELWRTTLWRLSYNAELRLADPRMVRQALHRWGLAIGIQTVRNWLHDETQIGPGDEGAIEAIAKASEDEGLLAKRTEVWEAIKAVRSLHVDAGFQLTRLLLEEIRKTPPRVAGRETRVDLGRGRAWMVEVEEIGASFEGRPSSQVNRLLWDEFE